MSDIPKKLQQLGPHPRTASALQLRAEFRKYKRHGVTKAQMIPLMQAEIARIFEQNERDVKWPEWRNAIDAVWKDEE